MAKGPQKYPGASTAYWYGRKYPGSRMESNTGVLHTTEGWTVPSYGGGASAPNLTALPDIKGRWLRWYQHFDIDRSSRALVNRSGGVETNTLNALQVELVGTCDERHAKTWSGKRAGVDYLFWPDAPDWALAELGKFVRWCHDTHGIKMSSPLTWKPYNKGQRGGSYGANGVRLSGSQWLNFYGWCGHQHVPENVHGDPGDIDMARVLAHARGTADDSGSGDGVAGTYTVKKGDTLSSIARAYDTTWQYLAGANGLCPPYLIHPGDKIKLPS
ncbi:LysM domain-containing protein [Streptomyces diacarni]|uniref:LysM peptidoglycan-binding domain-containing protein n=1 Tax=Streptomyces diacarni TaxID=2800381 RepID=UPI0033F58320